MGYDLVEGSLLCGHEELTLSFKQRDRAFRKNPLLSVTFAYAEIESIQFLSKWFQPKRIVLRTITTEKLEEFPGARVGEVELFVRKESIPQAKRVAELVEFRKSEARLEKAEMRIGRLEGEE